MENLQRGKKLGDNKRSAKFIIRNVVNKKDRIWLVQFGKDLF